MTRADFLALPPDAQNALVDYHVMGWEPCQAGLAVHVGDDGLWRYTGGDGRPLRTREQGRVPAYATDLAAAWQVVEHFRADPAFDWVTDFVVFASEDVATGRRGYLVDFAGGNYPGRGAADTFPLAVCLAALGMAGVVG